MNIATAALLDGIAIVDADTHLTEPHDLWLSRAPKGWEDRVPQVREVEGRPMWTIDGEVFGSAVGAAVILPDGSKMLGTEFMKLGIDEVHAGASMVGPRLAVMDDARDPRADRVPQRRRLRRSTVCHRRRSGAPAAVRHDLQRRDGRDPGAVGQPHVPDGAAAVVGHRRRGQGGRAGARDGPARRQHQRRPAERGPPGSRRTPLGPALGGVRRPRDAGELPHRCERRRR